MSASWNSQTQTFTTEPFGQSGVRQFIFPVLTCMSLACMVLSLGMWVRSHYLVDQFVTERADVTCYISSIYGRVLVAWGEEAPYRGPRDEWVYRQYPMNESPTDGWKDSIWKRVGIEWRSEPHSPAWGGERVGWVRVRWPFIAGVWGVLPLVRVFRERHRKRALARIGQGMCPQCGYDIRHTPYRCPECGVAPLQVQV